MKAFIKKILNALFGHIDKVVEKIPPAPDLPEIPTQAEIDSFPSSIKKVAIIIGHGNGDSGAESWDGQKNEFGYNSKVARKLEAECRNKTIKLFWRGSAGIKGVAKEAVAWKPDLSIELHLNSFERDSKGCEVLVLEGDATSGEIARNFARAFTSKFNRKLRRDEGVNWIDSGDRGAASLQYCSPIPQSILVEPFFISNPNEWIDSAEYADFLMEWLKTI